MSCTGNGATITFTTSGFTARYRQIGSYRRRREVVDDTALGDDFEKSCPGSVVRSDPIEVELFWDGDAQPPIAADPEPVVIMYPPKTGQSVGAKITGTGYITQSNGPVFENDTRQQGSFSLKLDVAEGGITAGS